LGGLSLASFRGRTGISELLPLSSDAATRSSSSAANFPSWGMTVMMLAGSPRVTGISIVPRFVLTGAPSLTGMLTDPGKAPNRRALSTIIDTEAFFDRSRKLFLERTSRPGRLTATSTLCRLSSPFQVGEKPSQ
jgi:hypothetical protein